MIGSNRFQNGSLIRVKNRNTADTWFFRYYEYAGNRRVYRKTKIGTAREFPRRADAEKAVLSLRVNINSAVRLPETVTELIAHYKKHELSEDSEKRFSTRSVYTSFLKKYVEPEWGHLRLEQVKTVAVETWLRSLDYAPGTKAKVRNIMSALFAHAKRHGMVLTNPIQGVRCSSKRRRDPDVLTAEEFRALLDQLPQQEGVMVLLAGTTGLRRSELIALKWEDIDFKSLEIRVNKSWVRGYLGETKTSGSAKPLPLHAAVATALQNWKMSTPYGRPEDFLFPSVRKNGSTPVWPDMVLRRVVRPAAARAGIQGKIVSWHTFRHSAGTNLRSLGVDVKTAQELLRHANVRTTLDLYTQAVSSQKREANHKLVELLLPSSSAGQNVQHLSAPSRKIARNVSD
jgi:integrase